MKKIKVNLFDNLTTHSVPAYGYRTFSPFQRPKYIEYHREGQEISVYTDKSLNLENISKDPAKLKVAWLVECREVHPHAYRKILELGDVFDYVFTFDDDTKPLSKTHLDLHINNLNRKVINSVFNTITNI